jgi:putative DNA modification/repair radical SAM protein
MDLQNKLAVLSGAAKYDVSCSSSGSSRKNTPGGLGNGHISGICHSWSDDGRCISLLKVLMTNICCYNCAYCVNRITNDIPRTLFTPEELINLTMGFYRRNYIEGLFLSSAVYKSPNNTMELMLEVVSKLRLVHHFNGYIHLKAIPGSDQRLLQEAGRYVDRMSVNIELPTSEGLKKLAPQKSKDAILKPMGYLKSQISRFTEERKVFRYSPSFIPAGQTTQMIVGATPDRDLGIMRLSEGLYRTYGLKRVYYSAYVPVSNHPALPSGIAPPLLREHRLYQADWLLRFYGFKADELLDEEVPDFDMELDPKSCWALNNLHLFPLEINKADYPMLVRVPGIGINSAKKIVAARKFGPLSYENLKHMGIVLKRARYFITCTGKYYSKIDLDSPLLRQCLVSGNIADKGSIPEYKQISLFDARPMLNQFGSYLQEKRVDTSGLLCI